MAQYKVPQDVEADDKLLGPFSPRQVVYLMVAGGLVALAVGLFNIQPFLVIIPVPFILFFGALALPLRKDQPVETYLAALVSYYLKPHTRLWTPGQRETTISISAPKLIDNKSLIRDLSREETTDRLTFLAELVDSEGRSINNTSMRKEMVDEANTINDIFDTHRFDNLASHAEKVSSMRTAIAANTPSFGGATIQTHTFADRIQLQPTPEPVEAPNPVIIQPLPYKIDDSAQTDIINNTNVNNDERKDDGEIFIPLH